MDQRKVGVQEQEISSIALLGAKIVHRESVSGIGKDMKSTIIKQNEELIWGGVNKKERFKQEIMLKPPEEGGTGVRDLVIALSLAKIKMLQNLIKRNQKYWKRWIACRLAKEALERSENRQIR